MHWVHDPHAHRFRRVSYMCAVVRAAVEWFSVVMAVMLMAAEWSAPSIIRKAGLRPR